MQRNRSPNHDSRNYLRTWLLGALVAGSLAAVRSAHAQEVFGTLREELTQQPVAGALITVSLAANDSTLVRTTTNERGVFRVFVGVAPVVVRALRVGQQPVVLARLVLGVGEQRDLSAALPDRPVQLMAINTRVDNRCRNDPVNGSRVAQLFNEARTALLSSRVAAQSRPARSVFRQAVQQYSVQERAVGDPLVREDTIASLQPFRANDVTRLLASGFREIRADNSIIYSAPDAELLTDDRFLQAYCLRLAEEPTEDPTMVGVTFEPARRRGPGFVQLRGTLWLDERTQELRRIDYGYRGLEPALTRTEPGGAVEYTRLDNGVWFVSDWSIRMPRVARVVTRGPGGQELDYVTVNGLQVTSGHVVAIEDAGQLLFTAGDDRGEQSLEELTASLVALRDSTHCEIVREDTLVTLTGTLRDSSGAPRAGAVVRARWTETRRLGDVGAQNTRYVEHERQLLAYTDAEGNFEICDLPRRVKIELVAGPTDQPVARTTLRLRRDAEDVRVQLTAR